jgi:hypothetical protein
MSVFGIRNRNDWPVPRAFPRSQFGYDQISHFHELFFVPNDTTTPTTPPVVIGGSPFTPLARKRGGRFAALGRWHITTQAAGQDMQGHGEVRVCACTAYAPVCISVYYSLVFAARGRLAEIDPIPQLFRFLGQI